MNIITLLYMRACVAINMPTFISKHYANNPKTHIFLF